MSKTLNLSEKFEGGGTKLLSCIGAIAVAVLFVLNKENIHAQWLYHTRSYAEYHYGPTFRVSVYIGATVFILFMLSILPDRRIPIVTAIGSKTMSVYLIHGFIIRLFAKYGWIRSFAHPVVGVWILSIGLVLLLTSKPVSAAGKCLGRGIDKILTFW